LCAPPDVGVVEPDRRLLPLLLFVLTLSSSCKSSLSSRRRLFTAWFGCVAIVLRLIFSLTI
jgi:hypothetical protein